MKQNHMETVYFSRLFFEVMDNEVDSIEVFNFKYSIDQSNTITHKKQDWNSELKGKKRTLVIVMKIKEIFQKLQLKLEYMPSSLVLID